MGRAPCCDKANVKKGPWSTEEDAKLRAYIEQHGTGGNWIALPQKIGLKRCGKSCRLRWLNYLRPNIKHGGFTEEEDNIISSLYISIGSRWSIIAAQLPGRTDNDIKNYWNTKLKKKLLGRRKQCSNFNNPKENSNSAETLSNSALERLQLHMQLHSLQNPFSFYNNPALWPKLHPFQENMIQGLESQSNLNHSSNPMMQKDEFYKLPTDDGVQEKGVENPKVDDLLEINIPMDREEGVEQFDMGIHQDSTLQDELGDILNNRRMVGSNYMTQEDKTLSGEFDNCFGEMTNGSSKDSLMWWSNDFDAKSASSNSWDSTATPVLQTGDVSGL